jgi:tetratricopeptide (TPR) repeat protein
VWAQEHRLLRDPYAYETAAEMYAEADTLPFDDTAARLVTDISRQLVQQGLTLEDEIIWATLQKLEPYRKSEQVQKALKTWTLVEYIRKARGYNSAYDSRSLISPVVQAYHQGEFDKVIALSRKLLLNTELNIRGELLQVVRNNLALALMHKNRDLCAQMELELLNTEKILYFPALINLTVVYERLGKREEAELLANRLTEYMKEEKLKMPLVDFNAAWFLGEKEDYRSVNKAWKRVNSNLMKKQEVPKYADYRKQLAAKYKSFSILKIGFIGKSNAGSGGSWIGFIIYWVAIAMMGTGLLSILIEEFNLSFYLMTLLILLYFTLFFILAWGIPSSVGGWIGLVVLEAGSYIYVLIQGTK